ncbi:hypothetical protein XFF6166_80113 [Xanthomonas citri pv. fuscans]|nr:hypothetical protein XFF6166_80113 [Xanthomonas citri pv. fuscans]SON99728.1 hypothetical protein XFF6960_200001 [Xanthomonas citri pv. fuscans]SOO09220.1 hypothetical protein XFF6970_330001 [Xanthomonas citri pv. fuscans]SOO15686.1 hypothetical protein XFF7766_600112 [Xanthomonas citri pv. fuscans]
MHRLKRLAQLAAGFQGAKDRRSKILTVDSLQIGSFLTAASRVLTWGNPPALSVRQKWS